MTEFVAESPVTQWFEASLYFRIPDGKHRVTEGSVVTGIQVTWQGDPKARQAAAHAEAERAFRELGLGQILDKLHARDDGDGTRITISVCPA